MSSSLTHNQKSLFVATGLMLFALFFGAGNLIFPAQMGQESGANFWSAILGFVLTGAGLPILGVAAIAYSGEQDVEALASRMHPWFGVCFAVALYLSIGPLFAMPRTATVSFEIGIEPFISHGDKGSMFYTIALATFSIVFFAVSYWIAMTPSKMVDRIGKILTPVLLICIAILTVVSIASPMGVPVDAVKNYAHHPAVEGFLQGYQTMDALAALVFAIIVLQTLRSGGIPAGAPLARMTIGAGVIAGVFLAIVYAAITYMGATSVPAIGMEDTGAAVLSGIANHYMGLAGAMLLTVIILLACISTAVGLIASCAEYFHRVFPQVSYRNFAILFTVVSCILANKGLNGIINFSLPVLFILYPLTVVLILLAFLHPMFGGKQSVYVGTLGLTLIVGLLDGAKIAFGLPAALQSFLDAYLPFYTLSLGWIVPAAVGFTIGALWPTKKKAG